MPNSRGDTAILDAAFISLRVAFVSASAATVLGTLAAVALVRFGRFRGRLLFASMIYAPLVMPEVITGLSMLLLFVAIAIDRGFWTVAIAHTTMAMCFVTVIVQSRLVDFDMNLEEAAMDLGAPPLRTFLTVTLPLILPAIAAAWMLAFALSLDDLVIASFTTGPGAATLPIRIYSEVRLGVKPEINAVCTIFVALSASRCWPLRSWRSSPGRGERRRADTKGCRSNPGSRPADGTDRPETRPERSPSSRATSWAAPKPAPRHAMCSIRSVENPVARIRSSGGDAEMRKDRPDDQRSQQHLDDNTSEVAEHPVPAAEKPLTPQRMMERDAARALLPPIRKPAGKIAPK